MINAFQSFHIYIAVKNYFYGSFDIVKYGLKTNIPLKTFEKRKDRYFFEKIAKKYSRDELVDLFVSNYISGTPPSWIGDFLTEESEETYQIWKGKIQSLAYLFTQDLNYICEEAVDFFDAFKEDAKVQYPVIYKFYFRKKINLETLVILDKLLGFNKGYKTKYGGNPSCVLLWDLIDKYRPFLVWDKKKFTEILTKKVTINMGGQVDKHLTKMQ